MNRRRYYKRRKRWERHNDKFYRNLYIRRLEEKKEQGIITFGEKIELDALKRANRRYKKGKWRW